MNKPRTGDPLQDHADAIARALFVGDAATDDQMLAVQALAREVMECRKHPRLQLYQISDNGNPVAYPLAPVDNSDI